MKKILLIMTGILFASPAIANEPVAGYTGGFTGPSSNKVITVEEAKKLSDDKEVVLVGNITQHVKSDKYLFKDASGTITVEIDQDEWRGQSISPEDTVEIIGEIDQSMFKDPKIDVDSVRKVDVKK